MITRQSFLERLTVFLTTQSIGRGEFGALALGDRWFVRDVERGANVTLARIDQADAFMSACEADPAHLDRARQARVAEAPEEAGQIGDRIGGQVGGAGGGGVIHGGDRTAAPPADHRDDVPCEEGPRRRAGGRSR